MSADFVGPRPRYYGRDSSNKDFVGPMPRDSGRDTSNKDFVGPQPRTSGGSSKGGGRSSVGSSQTIPVEMQQSTISKEQLEEQERQRQAQQVKEQLEQTKQNLIEKQGQLRVIKSTDSQTKQPLKITTTTQGGTRITEVENIVTGKTNIYEVSPTKGFGTPTYQKGVKYFQTPQKIKDQQLQEQLAKEQTIEDLSSELSSKEQELQLKKDFLNKAFNNFRRYTSSPTSLFIEDKSKQFYQNKEEQIKEFLSKSFDVGKNLVKLNQDYLQLKFKVTGFVGKELIQVAEKGGVPISEIKSLLITTKNKIVYPSLDIALIEVPDIASNPELRNKLIEDRNRMQFLVDSDNSIYYDEYSRKSETLNVLSPEQRNIYLNEITKINTKLTLADSLIRSKEYSTTTKNLITQGYEKSGTGKVVEKVTSTNLKKEIYDLKSEKLFYETSVKYENKVKEIQSKYEKGELSFEKAEELSKQALEEANKDYETKQKDLSKELRYSLLPGSLSRTAAISAGVTLSQRIPYIGSAVSLGITASTFATLYRNKRLGKPGLIASFNEDPVYFSAQLGAVLVGAGIGKTILKSYDIFIKNSTSKIAKKEAQLQKDLAVKNQEVSINKVIKIKTDKSGNTYWKAQGEFQATIYNTKTGKIVDRIKQGYTSSEIKVLSKLNEQGMRKAIASSVSSALRNKGVRIYNEQGKMTLKFYTTTSPKAEYFVKGIGRDPVSGKQFSISRGKSSEIYTGDIRTQINSLNNKIKSQVRQNIVPEFRSMSDSLVGKVGSKIVTKRFKVGDGIVSIKGRESVFAGKGMTDVYTKIIKSSKRMENAFVPGQTYYQYVPGKGTYYFTLSSKNNINILNVDPVVRGTSRFVTSSFEPSSVSYTSKEGITKSINDINEYIKSSKKDFSSEIKKVLGEGQKTLQKIKFQPDKIIAEGVANLEAQSSTYSQVAKSIKDTISKTNEQINKVIVPSKLSNIATIGATIGLSSRMVAPAETINLQKEIQESDRKLFLKQREREKQMIKQSQSMFPMQRIKQEPKSVQREISSTRQVQEIQQKNVQRFNQRINQQMRQTQKQVNKASLVPIINVPNVLSPQPIKPLEDDPIKLKIPSIESFNQPQRRVTKKVQEGYNVYIKRPGSKNFEVLNRVPLSKDRAKDIGSYYVSNTLGRTFKIIKSKSNAQEDLNFISIPEGYFKQTKQKLRGYKIKKGRAKDIGKQYIEKTSYILESPGEKRQIQNFRKRVSNLMKGGVIQNG